MEELDPLEGKDGSTTDETVDEARQIVHEDPQITLEDLSDALEISKGSAHTILHRHLSLRSLCARWVPYSLNDSRKASRLEKAKEWIKVIKQEKTGLELLLLMRKVFPLFCWQQAFQQILGF